MAATGAHEERLAPAERHAGKREHLGGVLQHGVVYPSAALHMTSAASYPRLAEALHVYLLVRVVARHVYDPYVIHPGIYIFHFLKYPSHMAKSLSVTMSGVMAAYFCSSVMS